MRREKRALMQSRAVRTVNWKEISKNAAAPTDTTDVQDRQQQETDEVVLLKTLPNHHLHSESRNLASSWATLVEFPHRDSTTYSVFESFEDNAARE